jgi:cytidylate kinase
MSIINIAIDGPSGAGKSTVAKNIAKKLGIVYLDTGAMYRAAALYALERGTDIADTEAVLKILPNIDIKICYNDNEQHVLLCGKDVSAEIRRHEISKAASNISKIPEVRMVLVEMQRKIASETNCVLDGRDITSFVLPNAKYKFYLTATVEERAKRRFEELAAKGGNLTYEQILADVADRDYNDMNRGFAPLVQTPDAVLIDSTDMSAEDVTERILNYVK